MIGKVSQCACCQKTFMIQNENQVMYCTVKCEQQHDLFQWDGGGSNDRTSDSFTAYARATGSV